MPRASTHRLNLPYATVGRYTGSGDKDFPWLLTMEMPRGSGNWRNVAVNADQFRIGSQYEAARNRLNEAMRERDGYRRPPAEPPLDAVEPQDKLTPRQARFCEHYAARPVATRAAMMAGYSTHSAASQGWKLLRHPLVLARLAELREERKLRYRIEPDTLHDKLEAVFFEALESGSHGAAIAALKFQAALGGLLPKPRAGAPKAEKDTDEGEKSKDEG